MEKEDTKSVYIYTYGCQMNVHDSEKMRGVLSMHGYESAESADDADLIVFNTCAIREKAEQKFYSQLGRIKHLKNRKKDLKIAVAGCVAQDSKETIFNRAPFVDFVLGPQNINSLGDIISSRRGLYIDDNPDIANSEFMTARESRTRAWVSIMYGCNNFCTYCIVPYTRGREVSRPSSSIVAEVRRLCESGYKEVTLLGQNVNSYKSDVDFPGLLSLIDTTGIKRVRFVTSHPRDLSPALVDAVASLPSLCEHIHLPLQSGSDKILDVMSRRYTLSEYLDKIESLRNKIAGIAITADIIVGFPGETDDDYLKTVSAIKEVRYDGLFAFKYSRRQGTRAYEIEDQVPDDIKSERLRHLLQIQEDITHKKNMLLEGTEQEILIEGPSETDAALLCGRTRTNKIVTIANHGEAEGDFVIARINRARLHSLEGTRIMSGHNASSQ